MFHVCFDCWCKHAAPPPPHHPLSLLFFCLSHKVGNAVQVAAEKMGFVKSQGSAGGFLKLPQIPADDGSYPTGLLNLISMNSHGKLFPI